MNSTFKKNIYLAVPFVVVFLVALLFITILPYVLLGGLILFLIFKIKGYFIKRKMKASSNSYSKTYSSNTRERYKADEKEDLYEDIVDVIDVDYKEVK